MEERTTVAGVPVFRYPGDGDLCMREIAAPRSLCPEAKDLAARVIGRPAH